MSAFNETAVKIYDRMLFEMVWLLVDKSVPVKGRLLFPGLESESELYKEYEEKLKIIASYILWITYLLYAQALKGGGGVLTCLLSLWGIKKFTSEKESL